MMSTRAVFQKAAVSSSCVRTMATSSTVRPGVAALSIQTTESRPTLPPTLEELNASATTLTVGELKDGFEQARGWNIATTTSQVVRRKVPPADPTPKMPARFGYDANSLTVRREWLEKQTRTQLRSIAQVYTEEIGFDTEKLQGNIERPIGSVKIPVAAAGPVLFHGANVDGFVFAPFATTEGALIASVCRGAKAISMSGGVRTWATQQRMARAPAFYCADPVEAVAMGEWMSENKDRIQEIVSRFSKRAKLREIIPVYDMNVCHVMLRYETGDAAGQNMTTVVSWQVAKWANETAQRELGIRIHNFQIDANMTSDKKPSIFSGLLGRGTSVSAQVDIPEEVLKQVLNIDSSKFEEATRVAGRMSERIGQISGFNGNVANVLGGMFSACGQDMACVGESSLSRFDVTKRNHPDGGVTATMYMPSLIVGTVGGGTSLPTQRECLEMIGCYGEGKMRRLAEIICGYCLALDISTYSAVAGGDFADAHDRLGRNRPEDKQPESAGSKPQDKSACSNSVEALAKEVGKFLAL